MVTLGGRPGTGVNTGNALQRFSKDFEEISKAIFIRKSDTYKWFQNYSSLGGK